VTRRAGHWICYRQADGQKCLWRNVNAAKKCEKCGKDKPKPRKPKHMVALEADYEHYIKISPFGERCGICLRARGSKRLDRDHDHGSGRPRGLLCSKCNRALPYWVTPEWLDAAARYLREAAR